MASGEQLNYAQDVIRCFSCEADPAEFNCNSCQVRLCSGCISNHVTSKKFRKHDIVPFTAREYNIILPICKSHPKIKCDFHCSQCNVAVCSQCVTSSHKSHDLSQMSDTYFLKAKTLKEDIEELENAIIDEYKKITIEMKEKLSKLENEYQNLKKYISDHGKRWHQEVDSVIDQLQTNVERMENEDLEILKKQILDMEKIIEDALYVTKVSKEIQNSNDVTQLIKYESRNEEFRKVPCKTEITAPTFEALDVDGKNLVKKFGTLSSSTKEEIAGYTIKTNKTILSISPTKTFLDKPLFVTDINTGCYISSMTLVNQNQLWIGMPAFIIRVSMKGEILQTVLYADESYPPDLSVTKDGNLVFTADGTVTMMKKGKIKRLVRTGKWFPSGVCCTPVGELLVCLFLDGRHKVVRYSSTRPKQEIEFDDEGSPLFALGPNRFMYIAQNRDENICVADINGNALVVVNPAGKLQFRYEGNPALKASKDEYFCPQGVATDSQCNILVTSKYGKQDIHILDRYGKFLRYLGLSRKEDEPLFLSVDSKDRLFASMDGFYIVKVIEYLK